MNNNAKSSNGNPLNKIFWPVLGIMAMGLAISVFFGIFRNSHSADKAKEHPAVGNRLLAVHLLSLSDERKEITLDDLKGKITLINFWATWCPPCVRELPHLIELKKHYQQNENVRVLMVTDVAANQNLEDLRKKVGQFLVQHQLSATTYVDVNQTTIRAAQFAEAHGGGIPLTMILDGQGNIRAVFEGYETGIEKSMKEVIDELIAEQLPD